MKDEFNFFDWVVGFFKKRKTVVQLTPEEIEREKREEEVRSKYALEQGESKKYYVVKYHYKNKWWYLRYWNDDDYSIEMENKNAIKISNQKDLKNVIKSHQDWIKKGHIHFF